MKGGSTARWRLGSLLFNLICQSLYNWYLFRFSFNYRLRSSRMRRGSLPWSQQHGLGTGRCPRSSPSLFRSGRQPFLPSWTCTCLILRRSACRLSAIGAGVVAVNIMKEINNLTKHEVLLVFFLGQQTNTSRSSSKIACVMDSR